MSKSHPVTRAVRHLRRLDIPFTAFVYDYDRYPGALGAAEFIEVDPHETAKTIVFTTSQGDGVVVVMHGDREVSTKALARLLEVKSCRPATADEASKWTGYVFGGTSPLGLKQQLPVFMESTLFELEMIYLNAGSRGFVIGVDPHQVAEAVNARPAHVTAG